MGYSFYERNTPLGKPMKRGYAIACKCHKKGCNKEIDRGLSYLCYSCTYYFCEEHRTVVYNKNDEAEEFDCFAGRGVQICEKCEKEYLKDNK